MSPEQQEHGGEPHQGPQGSPQGRWRRYGVKMGLCARTLVCQVIQELVKSGIRELLQGLADRGSGMS